MFVNCLCSPTPTPSTSSPTVPRKGEERRLIKCRYEKDSVQFTLKKSTTLAELIEFIEKGWGKGKGVKFKDEEGDWVKMRRNKELKEVWEEAETKVVTLKVFSKKVHFHCIFFFFFKVTFFLNSNRLHKQRLQKQTPNLPSLTPFPF